MIRYEWRMLFPENGINYTILDLKKYIVILVKLLYPKIIGKISLINDSVIKV